MMMKIILFICFIPIPLIIFFVMRNEAKRKKNIILGVTLPHDARENEEVKAIVGKFLRQQNIVIAVLMLLVVPQFFMKYDSVVMMWYLVWLIAALVLPWVPYVKSNKTLKALKAANGWYSESTGVMLVDTKLACAPKKMLSLWVFIPAIVISLVPVVITIITMRGRDEFWVMLAVYALLAVMVAAFYFFYRIIYRQRAEVVDENTSINRALTQVRRYNWAKCWAWTAWLTSLFALLLWVFSSSGLTVLLLTIVYSVMLLFVTLRAEFRTRKVQQKLTEESGRAVYTDDDDKWLFGMFYYNPNDSHVMVNRRTGVGMTMNLAKAPGKIIIGFTVLLLLSMPFFGLWMSQEETTPVRLGISGTQIVATHTGAVYSIDMNSITSAYLLDKLPRGTRTMGTGMESVLKGNFRYDGIGDCRVCLDPRVPPFIVVTAGGRTYILGSSDVNETQKVFGALEGRGPETAAS